MRTPTRQLSLLFLLALLGVLLAGAILAGEVGGLPLLLGYTGVTGVLLVVGVARARSFVPRPPPQPARCACCDGDHGAPARVR